MKDNRREQLMIERIILATILVVLGFHALRTTRRLAQERYYKLYFSIAVCSLTIVSIGIITANWWLLAIAIFVGFISIEGISLIGRKVSIRDFLTGLYRKEFFFRELLPIELAGAKRMNFPISFVMIDIDNFKEYNDKYGHVQGDKLLQKMGKILKESIRESDFAIRYGGDEFLLILICDEEEAEEVIKRITNAAKREGIFISYGISQWKPGEDIEKTIERADRRMYKMKYGTKATSNLFDDYQIT